MAITFITESTPPRRGHLDTGNHKISMDILPEKEDLEGKLKLLLTFGKVIGAYSTGTLLDRATQIIPFALGLVALVDLVGIALLKPNAIRTATEIAGDFGVPGFYCLGTFLYYYMQRNTEQLRQIFVKWRKLEIKHEDARLKRFVNLSSVCILTSAILENATFHFKLFPVFESPETYKNSSSLQVYYNRSHGHWALYVPFNPVVSIVLCVMNKLALYIWNYADVFIAVVSRALYFRFSDIIGDPYGDRAWDRVWHDYTQLSEVARMVENFLSPIIFGCYTMNMYAICMQLHMWLTPSENNHYLHTLYHAWSFLHLLGRVFLVSVNAAKINEEIINFQRKMQLCPLEKYEHEIERFGFGGREARRGYGLSGLGCFVITKPFILSIISVAFTFEVFLLQSDSIQVG